MLVTQKHHTHKPIKCISKFFMGAVSPIMVPMNFHKYVYTVAVKHNFSIFLSSLICFVLFIKL